MVMICCLPTACHWNSTQSLSHLLPARPFLFQRLTPQFLQLTYCKSTSWDYSSLQQSGAFQLMKPYQFLILSHFIVPKTFIRMTLLSPQADATTLCATAHGATLGVFSGCRVSASLLRMAVMVTGMVRKLWLLPGGWVIVTRLGSAVHSCHHSNSRNVIFFFFFLLDPFISVVFWGFALFCFNSSIAATQGYIIFRYPTVTPQVHKLCCAHPKCSYYLLPYGTIIISLTIFPMLFHPGDIHSITGRLCLPLPLHPFCPSLNLSPLAITFKLDFTSICSS